jgi:hypothetical protein
VVRRGRGLALLAATLFASGITASIFDTTSICSAQTFTGSDVSDTLIISAKTSTTWQDGGENVAQVDGGVSIKLDRVELRADHAVIWLSPAEGALLGEQQVKIALLGHSELRQNDVTVERDRNFVTATVRGNIRIVSENPRFTRSMASGAIYRAGYQLRPDAPPEMTETPIRLPEEPATTRSATLPATTQFASGETVLPGPKITFAFPGTAQTVTSSDGRAAIVITGGVRIFRTAVDQSFLELQADKAVLYTRFRDLRGLDVVTESNGSSDAITGAYLEGDVRATFNPGPPKPFTLPRVGEVRMSANRIYYEFASDRAILTDAVVHTVEPRRQTPVIIRAETLRQLALNEYRGEHVRLSSSAFATPSYAIGADKMYVRQIETPDPTEPQEVFYDARNVTLQAYNLPFFYLPGASGTITKDGFPLREASFESSNKYGVGIRTYWGLFETLGRVRPQDLDAAFHADYFVDRGPATGLDLRYTGGFVTDTTRDPWNFEGLVKSYIVLDDQGKDVLGAERVDVTPPDTTRGRIIWQHQHFFPGDWQLQARAGYESDPTFLEEWFKNEFYNEPQYDESIYLKRQRDTEALTFYANANFDNHISSADLAQEQFVVEQQPEIGYRRMGDSFGDDKFTFFSTNTFDQLRFNETSDSLGEQGYSPGVLGSDPGIPSLGQTGTRSSPTDRADFRQEVDYPFSAGQFKFVPYVVGRFTPYSDSPSSGQIDRLYGAGGTRVSTAFWKVDDYAESELFDIHRVRHVVEPYANVFGAAETEDRNQVFIYDQQTDNTYDVSGGQIALLQRWQTKRGGPGRWRNVDFLELNVEGNFFLNRPSDAELSPPETTGIARNGTPVVLAPGVGPLNTKAFRGTFFDSLPETSIPRDSVNADLTWHASDTAVVLADENFNADHQQLAQASVGLAVLHDLRTTYFIGQRYIDPLSSNITTVAVGYQLTAKYSFSFSQSYDFGNSTHDVSSDFQIMRSFDRFYATVDFYYDKSSDEGGFRVSLLPTGITPHGPADLNNIFGSKR